MADKKVSFKIGLLAAFFLSILWPVKAAAQTAGTDAGAGIIEVQSGFLDGAGRFWKMKSASGFLIANKDSDTYIVTNCSTVSNTPRSIKKYCRKNGIAADNAQFQNYIQVVVEGDVTAQAEVVVKSAQKDYCVLSTANVVSQRESLKLGDSGAVEVNDLVYAYGFPAGAEKQTGQETPAYSIIPQPVQGAVTEKEAYLEGGVYIAHSAPMVQGYAGGPLLDAEGYVIGLNCRQSPEEDTGISYALPIHEICAVLDNFSIYYGSRAIDEAYAQLESARDECSKKSETGEYKNASVQELEKALAQAAEALAQEEPEAAVLTEAYQTLAAARDGLVPKTKALSVIIRVLPVFIIVLFLWALVLSVKNAREKKLMNVPQQPRNMNQPEVESRGYANASQAQYGDYPYQKTYPHVSQNQGAGYGDRQAAYAARERQGGYPDQAGMQRGAQSIPRPRQAAVPPAGRRLRLIRQKTGEMISVHKNQFVLGKSQTQADFAVADNQTVSRKHAVLLENNGSWYVDDLNSLNGTYLNGRKLTAGQPFPLKDGDEIVLADESFLVQG